MLARSFGLRPVIVFTLISIPIPSGYSGATSRTLHSGVTNNGDAQNFFGPAVYYEPQSTTINVGSHDPSAGPATRTFNGTPDNAAAVGTVRTGALEMAGVNASRTMVDMIGSLRAFEAGQRAITTIDETLRLATGQVGGLPG